jgi:diguanylate cyclase (GGDEF)-like protein/PAS domain S-box-containing protein
MTEGSNFYKDIIDHLYDGVYFVDRERVITYWNKGAERITGYDASRVVGHSCRDDLLNHITATGEQLCQGQCPLAACMEDGTPREADVFLHHADGHRVPVLVRAAPLRDSSGKIIGAVETFSGDLGLMSVRSELRQLRRSVQMDSLTEVGNRTLLEGRLRAAIEELKHHNGTTMGLLFIDIDNFKQCNDAHGHEIGDKVLHMVAATLQHNLRKSDVIGRWGGDEFIAILYDVESVDNLKLVSDKLRTLVEHSRLDLPAISLTSMVSIGATLLLPSDTIETVVNRADQLLYQSKLNGRNQVRVG